MKSKKQDISTRGARLARPRAWMKFEGANRFDNGFQPPLRNNNDLWGSCFGHTLILLVCILTYWIHHWRWRSSYPHTEKGKPRELTGSFCRAIPKKLHGNQILRRTTNSTGHDGLCWQALSGETRKSQIQGKPSYKGKIHLKKKWLKKKKTNQI